MNEQRVAFPFLTLPPSVVGAGCWHFRLNDEVEKPLTDSIEGWDYNSRLCLIRRVRLDLTQAASALQIGRDVMELGVLVRAGTGGSGQLPRLLVASTVAEIHRGTGTVDLQLQLDGAALSKVLHLYTDVILLNGIAGTSALSPRDRGDRVWSDRHRVWLEGALPRFPVEESPLDDEYAPWQLFWIPGDWHRDFHGAVRLCLNSRRPDVLKKVAEQDPLTLQSLLADAVSQMLESFLAEDDSESIARECAEGTLGHQVSCWIRQLFPTGGIRAARETLRIDPGRFRKLIWSLSYTSEAE